MDACNTNLSRNALRKSFLLTYDRMRRYKGEWHLERRLLFPAYVLLESENEERLLRELKEFKKISESESCVVRINPEEEEFLKSLYGKACHLKMSRGILFKGAARITEGPLKGMENRILRIDRHKRLARVEITGKPNESFYYEQKMESGMKMKPEYRYIPAGLEITEKVV